MTAQVLAGVVAGLVFGYVLQRGQLCFHASFRGLLDGRPALFKAWALGAAVTAVGLATLDAVGPGTVGAVTGSWSMSSSLALRPVANLVGGGVFGVGMAVAFSCVSGLFYKLGAGMAGALVGLVGWGLGELAADLVALPGGRVLEGRETLPTLLGVPRLVVAVVVLAAVALVLARTDRSTPAHAWQWGWPLAGVALGLAATFSWVTAGASGAGFGASTSGAVASVAGGSPAWWRIAFLVALVPGATVAARTAGGWWLRVEVPVRYVQLASGGALMGAGARWAGGCNLGHALSGMGQLNLSSALVVTSMIGGVAVTRSIQRGWGTRAGHHDPAYDAVVRDPARDRAGPGPA
jgi:uncharacterized protein